MNRSSCRRPFVLASAVLASACSFTGAEVRLASVFSDHMVLQRGKSNPIWGTTTPGAKVEVSVDGKVVDTTTAKDDGTFRAELPKLKAGGPHAIVVRGDGEATLSDVLAGDVWVASGQSNMQWDLNGSNNPAEEIAAANHPNIRLYYVPRVGSATPVKGVDAEWTTCTPETAKGFSAVAYFFGRHLNRELDIPIGLIHTSWGGTPAEAWTPLPRLEALTDLPEVQKAVAQRKAGADPAALERFAAEQHAWLKAAGRLDPGVDAKAQGWEAADLDASAWETMALPADWVPKGVPNGCVWFRREVDVPAELAGKPLSLSLGQIDDYDTTFFNGRKVGATGADRPNPWSARRKYDVPGELVKAGRNVIAVRVFDTGGGAGLVGPRGAMTATVGERSIPLAGEWRYRAESVFKPTPGPQGMPPAGPMQADGPNAPAALYNGMVAPLGEFGIAGAIWYQGESNAGRHQEYEKLLTTMIESWRDQFDQGDFPFYVVGLANFRDPTDDPNQASDWAGLRAAQHAVDRNVRNVATTVTIDIGDAKDIHPKNKQDVGKRLALVALDETYDKELVSRGPVLDDADFEDGKVELEFDHVGGGLKMAGDKLESFSVAGEDGKFHWAEARIEGDDEVVVSSPNVPRPVVVRYAWADNPKASLFNAEGLPAEPFEARK